MWMSGRLTTAREPRERGCSGSEMVEMRSMEIDQSGDLTRDCERCHHIICGPTEAVDLP